MPKRVGLSNARARNVLVGAVHRHSNVWSKVDSIFLSDRSAYITKEGLVAEFFDLKYGVFKFSNSYTGVLMHALADYGGAMYSQLTSMKHRLKVRKSNAKVKIIFGGRVDLLDLYDSSRLLRNHCTHLTGHALAHFCRIGDYEPGPLSMVSDLVLAIRNAETGVPTETKSHGPVRLIRV